MQPLTVSRISPKKLFRDAEARVVVLEIRVVVPPADGHRGSCSTSARPTNIALDRRPCLGPLGRFEHQLKSPETDEAPRWRSEGFVIPVL